MSIFAFPEEYEDGHLPGAVYLDTNQLEDSSNDWNRRIPAEIEAILLPLGISHDTTAVLYGRDTVGDPNEKWTGRRAEQIGATRAAAILMYAGVKDFRLLDGGIYRRCPGQSRLRGASTAGILSNTLHLGPQRETQVNGMFPAGKGLASPLRVIEGHQRL